MKKHLLIGTTVLALALSATSIYAQVVSGTSIVDKMKAVAHSFTLSTELNAGQTGLTSEPVKGKKTGDILTAGEWNRMLELVSEGGSSSGTGSPVVKTKYKPVTASSLTFDIPTGSRYATAKIFGSATGYGANGAEENNEKMEIFFDFQNGKSSGIHSIVLGNGPELSLGYSWEGHAFGTRVSLKEGDDTLSTSNAAIWMSGVRPTVSVTGNQLTISGLSNQYWSQTWLVTFYQASGGAGGATTVTSGSPALYKCTNAQSADSTNAPCYGASRNGGAGTNQYRVISCTDNDGIRSYTMSSILNFGNLVANKWSVSVNGGTIECDDGTVLVMDITGSSSAGTSPSNIVYINPDNTDFAPLDCTPGVNYMINPIAFSAASASSFTTQKVAVLGAGSWQVKGTGFTRIRNKDSGSAQALRISSVIDSTTTHLLDSSVDAGMYANSFLDPVSVPSGKTAELRASVKNNTLHGGNIVAWCN